MKDTFSALYVFGVVAIVAVACLYLYQPKDVVKQCVKTNKFVIATFPNVELAQYGGDIAKLAYLPQFAEAELCVEWR